MKTHRKLVNYFILFTVILSFVVTAPTIEKPFVWLMRATGLSICLFIGLWYLLSAFIRRNREIDSEGKELSITSPYGHDTEMTIKEIEEKFMVTHTIEEQPDMYFGRKEDYVIGIDENKSFDHSQPNQHGIIQAPSGMGKDYSIFLNYIIQKAKMGESMIIIDPKTESYNNVSVLLKEYFEYTVCLLNEKDILHSDGINIMAYVHDETSARLVANVVYENLLEPDAKRSNLETPEKGVLFYAIVCVCLSDKTEDPTLKDVIDFLSMDIEEIEEYHDMFDQDSPQVRAYDAIKDGSENYKALVYGSLRTKLGKINTEIIRKMTSYNDIDLSLPGKAKCAYFLAINQQDRQYRAITTTAISLLHNELFKIADDNDGKLPVTVNFLFDEFATTGILPGIKENVGFVRSAGINYMFCIQNLGQLKDMYSGHQYETFTANAAYFITLGAGNLEDAKVLSEMTGTVTVNIGSEEFLNGYHKTAEQTRAGKGKAPSRSASYFQNLRSKAVVFPQNGRYFEVDTIPWTENPYVKYAKYISAKEYTPRWVREEEIREKEMTEFLQSVSHQKGIKGI